MFVSKVLSRVSRSACGSSSLLSAWRRPQHLTALSNHFHSLLHPSPNTLIPVQVNSLWLPINTSSTLRCGFSSSAVPEPNEKEQGSTTADPAKTNEGANITDQAENEEAANETKESDSDSECDLSKDDLIKLVADKEELLKLKQNEIEKMQDTVLRTYADMEYVLNRTSREADNSKKFASQSLLDVADNLGRASSVVTSRLIRLVALSAVTSINNGLKRLYIEKLKPLEVTYHFNNCVSPLLGNSDFDAKPMVMVLGQYSTGKTTFIKHLLNSTYPGANIGPEPTTDRFVVVMSGPDERIIPGNTVAVRADMPFSGLTAFGTSFLSKFECSQMPHPLLEHITFVDTPGVLSGEKQRTQRAYDFTGVTSWFAAKCDLILLLFDPHKLDISDEFKRVISSLRGHDDKIRVVLNKADQIDSQELMRVYGALMWSLGKVLNTPEVMRVYISSFNNLPLNDKRVNCPIEKGLFEKEQDDLLSDLKDIPKKACDRRINEFVKRARAAKIHACIIGHLKKEMPFLIRKAKTQQRLIDNLEAEFRKVQRRYHLPPADFPNVEHFKEVLSGFNFDRFHKLKPRMIQAVDDMLNIDIPKLIEDSQKSL